MNRYAVEIRVHDLDHNTVPIDESVWLIAPDETMALTAALYDLAEQQDPQSLARVHETMQLHQTR